jgi:hypothetical protein
MRQASLARAVSLRRMHNEASLAGGAIEFQDMPLLTELTIFRRYVLQISRYYVAKIGQRHGCGKRTTSMDEDLEQLTRHQLITEVKKLRAGIRQHRDSTGHELCWHHPRLWSLLPEKLDPDVAVPAWPQFLRGCLRYRESLDAQLPNAPRVTGEFDR